MDTPINPATNPTQPPPQQKLCTQCKTNPPRKTGPGPIDICHQCTEKWLTELKEMDT